MAGIGDMGNFSGGRSGVEAFGRRRGGWAVQRSVGMWERWSGLRRLESEMGGAGDRVAVSERGSRGKREARSGERKTN